MKIIKPYVQLMLPIDGMAVLQRIELAGRVCYKSEERITDKSCIQFVATLIRNGHEAILEHAPNISIKFVCDRGVSHEIVRHRLFSFAQESTRYCNYGKENEITVIDPCFWRKDTPQYETWRCSMLVAEDSYLTLLRQGATPQEARSVLPNSLKTELVVTGNVRELRHFLRLRTAKDAHPQMREVAITALDVLQNAIPVVFDDIDWPEDYKIYATKEVPVDGDTTDTTWG